MTADVLETLESVDAFARIRNALRLMAQEKGEWSGIPLPIEGTKLVVHPSYVFAKVCNPEGAEEKLPDNVVYRNNFYSTRYRSEVLIWQEDGKLAWSFLPQAHSVDQQINTMSCSVAWGVEQEANAIRLLASLLPHHMFKSYLLTGAFIETSWRSGLVYMFRKLRPTLVFSKRLHPGRLQIMTSLCMHPIAYYADSWAGGMCPTDDVIAHLMLMRGDEHMFWKRSNQHPPFRPEAGL